MNNMKVWRLVTRRGVANVKYPPPLAHYESLKKPRKYTFKIGLLCFLMGATITYNYPLYTLGEKLIELPDDNDLEAKASYVEGLEKKLQSLDIVTKYRNDGRFKEFRGWNHLDSGNASLSSFHGTLTTPGGVAIKPISFHSDETGEDVVIVHLGRRLAGYPFIVHGGILGMVMDEIFKSNLIKEFPALNFDTVHTKNLKLNYKFPTFVNQFIVIKSSLAKINDVENVYSVQSDVSTLDNMLLIQAEASLVSDVSPTVSQSKSKTKGWW